MMQVPAVNSNLPEAAARGPYGDIPSLMRFDVVKIKKGKIAKRIASVDNRSVALRFLKRQLGLMSHISVLCTSKSVGGLITQET